MHCTAYLDLPWTIRHNEKATGSLSSSTICDFTAISYSSLYSNDVCRKLRQYWPRQLESNLWLLRMDEWSTTYVWHSSQSDRIRFHHCYIEYCPVHSYSLAQISCSASRAMESPLTDGNSIVVRLFTVSSLNNAVYFGIPTEYFRCRSNLCGQCHQILLVPRLLRGLPSSSDVCPHLVRSLKENEIIISEIFCPNTRAGRSKRFHHMKCSISCKTFMLSVTFAFDVLL